MHGVPCPSVVCFLPVGRIMKTAQETAASMVKGKPMTRATRKDTSSSGQHSSVKDGYACLVTAIESASRQMVGRAAAALNQALVIRNWLVGAYLVEYEQHGKDRATYGDALLETLCRDLTALGLKGFGVSLLERMRRLYLLYPQVASVIRQPLVTEFADIPAHSGSYPIP